MVTQPIHLSYDGSFEGFLTCIFHIFDEKMKVTGISYSEQLQPDMFSKVEEIITDIGRSNRVKKGILQKEGNAVLRKIEYAFLSEKVGIEMKLLAFIKLIFNSKIPIDKDFSNPACLRNCPNCKDGSQRKTQNGSFYPVQTN